MDTTAAEQATKKPHCCVCHGVCVHPGAFIYCDEHKSLGQAYLPQEAIKPFPEGGK